MCYFLTFQKYCCVSLHGFCFVIIIGLTKATCDMKNFNHVTAMADYALRLREQLEYVNEHSFNNFKIRIGNFKFFYYGSIYKILLVF